MDSPQHSMKRPARCLAALEGDVDRSTFLAATTSLRATNELHVLDYNEDTSELWCPKAYSLPHEAWALASCPSASHLDLVLATYSTAKDQRTALYRMDRLADRPSVPELAPHQSTPAAVPMTQLLHLGEGASRHGDVRAIAWNAVLPEQVATAERRTVRLWQLSHGAAASSAAEVGAAAPPGADAEFGSCKWDPHHAHSLALGVDHDIVTLDTRSMKEAVAVGAAHEQRVASLDYNSNRPNAVLSAGDDYYVRWWDLRRPSAPLLALRAHSHWVTSATFNRFHDQLALSTGTDGAVKLWRAGAASSAPSADEAANEAEEDGLVEAFETHDTTVVGAVWSAADAWDFCSLSIDGKVAIHHVPPSVKYQILL